MEVEKGMKMRMRKVLVGCVVSCVLAVAGCSVPSPASAFTPKTELFPGTKGSPVGYTNLVEPNVLLLIDTSGSMTFRMRNDTSTYGDGSSPYGGQSYLGRDLDSSNNDLAGEYNYHPLHGYIPVDELPGNTSYLAYDDAAPGAYRWVRIVRGDPILDSLLPQDYRLGSSDQIQRRRQGWYDVTNADDLFPLNDPDNFRFAFYGGSYYLERRIQDTTRRYKYPNDSRLYILKNVMYRILSDPSLVGGLRLALSTYHQDNRWARGSYYRYYPTSGGTVQNTSWQTSWIDKALLRENFASTSGDAGAAHLSRIRQWFDCTEEAGNPGNPELRAVGSTPLAASIFSSSDSARKFFTASGVVTDWCQDNWLIVLTDGADDAFSSDPQKSVRAVRDLYNTIPMTGGRRIRTFVVGLVDPGVQTTLASVLNDMADYGDDGVKNGSATAYFPQEMDELLQAFRAIFQEIQDFSSSGGAPLVHPARTAEGSARVYSMGFKPRENRQWLGYLSAYDMAGGVMGATPLWKAEEKLAGIRYNARSVFTADWDGGTAPRVAGTNLKSFERDNGSSLRPFLAGTLSQEVLSDSVLGDFMDWVRGRDVWDEEQGDERWKLGDIFHGGMSDVGAPCGEIRSQLYKTYAGALKTRPRRLYVHANDGMLHCIDSEPGSATDGAERWAFIPPNVLGFQRLLGSRYDGASFGTEKRSAAKYLLDGPLVAGDVLLGGEFRTVLLGALGRAGCGLYALDVTDETKPQFLWAVENNCYDPASMALRPADERTYMKWTRSSSGPSSSLSAVESGSAVPSRLRLTVSTPTIGTVRLASGERWVAVLGGGAQWFPLMEGGSDGGKAVYVLDMDGGGMVRELLSSDLGAVVAPISVERDAQPMRIRRFYAGDHKGAVFEGDLSASSPDGWSLSPVFTPGTVSPGAVTGIPFAPGIGMIRNRTWLFWGTGDPDGLFGEQTGQNYIISMKKSTTPLTFGDLEELTGDSSSLSPSGSGWYLPLRQKEMVTTPPALYRGYLFIATYIPSTDRCAAGDAAIYILNAATGKGGWSEDGVKRVDLGGMKVAGITVIGEKVYAGVTRFPGASEIPSELGENVVSDGNVLVFDIPESAHDPDAPEDVKENPIYWREWIHE